MKTIAERAKDAGIICQYKSDYRYDKRSVEFGYTQGATEQKAIDDAECVNQVLMGKGSAINYYKQGYHDAIEKACVILSDLGVFNWMADNAQEGFSPEVYKDQFVKCLTEK